MPRNHTIEASATCKAIRYAGSLGKNQRQHRGTRCDEKDGVQDGLCWTHRKTIELGRATREQVMKGER